MRNQQTCATNQQQNIQPELVYPWRANLPPDVRAHEKDPAVGRPAVIMGDHHVDPTWNKFHWSNPGVGRRFWFLWWF